MSSPPIRVLVVDDSAIVRRILTDTLGAEPDIEVVGTAPDAIVAREKIAKLQPDVLTLDIEMPRMDGLTFLKEIMREKPLPVIVISSIGGSSGQAAMEAMRSGAVEVLAKPSGPFSVGELRTGLAMKVRAAARARLRRAERLQAAIEPPPPLLPQSHPADTIIAIGASTGGTQALEHILRALPREMPPIVVVQHIPAGFSRALAVRLDQVCAVAVSEAADGEAVAPGRVLIAPGDFHMLVRRSGQGYRVSVKTGPRVCYQRPSVDVLFHSVAESAGPRAVGVILTGMGSDGADGMRRMKQRGARNVAQDEATCVVFGMPKEAIRAGAVHDVLPLDRIAPAMLRYAATQLAATRQDEGLPSMLRR